MNESPTGVHGRLAIANSFHDLRTTRQLVYGWFGVCAGAAFGVGSALTGHRILNLAAVACAAQPAAKLLVHILVQCAVRTPLIEHDAVYCAVTMAGSVAQLLWAACLFVLSRVWQGPAAVHISVSVLLAVRVIAVVQQALVFHISRTTIWSAYLPRIRETVIAHEVVAALQMFANRSAFVNAPPAVRHAAALQADTLPAVDECCSMFSVHKAVAMTFLDTSAGVCNSEELFEQLIAAVSMQPAVAVPAATSPLHRLFHRGSWSPPPAIATGDRKATGFASSCAAPEPEPMTLTANSAGVYERKPSGFMGTDGARSAFAADCITTSQLEKAVGHQHQHLAKQAVKLLDPSGSGKVSRAEFVAVVSGLSSRRAGLRSTLRDYQRMVRTLSGALTCVSIICLFFAVLGILHADVLGMGTSIVTGIFAFSIAFGSTLQSFFEGLIFVFVVRPYDVGDRVFMPDAQGQQLDLVVTRMNLLTTVFTSSSGQYMILSNSILRDTLINNAYRSVSREHRFMIKLPGEIPLDIVQGLHARLQKARERAQTTPQAPVELKGHFEGSDGTIRKGKGRTASEMLAVVRHYLLEEGLADVLPHSTPAP